MHPLAAVSGVLLAASMSVPDADAVKAAAARFGPVDIAPDIAALPASERLALRKLIEAARLMDSLFLRQVWAGNPSLVLRLAADPSPLGRAQLDSVLLNKGPWSRLDENAPFMAGVPAKPPGASFYPEDATREEIERWIAALPAPDQAAARGFYTVVRRQPDRSLTLVPFSREYQDELSRAAALLQEAASATQAPTLRAFLAARAQAFLTNDYYDSDVLWMDLDSALEPTIGPYEVYEDELFNYKAAFEAFITVRDDSATARLALGARLQELEDSLPIDKAFRNPKLGALSPIRVVNLVFASGDASRGVQTIAYNLPNDERITAAKGSKKVMLRNVQQAKFDQILVPLARLALSPDDAKAVSFEAFFTWVLMHELMHGLGPHSITVGGRATTVRAEMKDLSSGLEEAKADVSGLWALQQLMDKGTLDRSLESAVYPTYVASLFRSLRWGLTESHAKGCAVQLGRFLDRKALVVRPDGTFGIDRARLRKEAEALTRDIMTLQAKGDRAGAEALFRELAVVRPEVQRVFDRAPHVPHDVRLRFVTAEELTR